MKFIVTILLYFSFTENISAQNLLIPYRRDSLWGYANEEGKIVIEPKYCKTSLFYKSKYFFIKNKDSDGVLRYGILRKDGKILNEPKYTNIISVSEMNFEYKPLNKKNENLREGYTKKFFSTYGENFFVATVGDVVYNYNILDSNAKTVLDDIQSIHLVKIFASGSANLLITKNHLFGLVNVNGKVIIPTKYDWIDYYSDDDNKDVIIASVDGYYTLLDGKGKILIPAKKHFIKKLENYENIQALFQVFQNGKSAIYDATGKMLFGFTNKKVYVQSILKNSREILTFRFQPIISEEYIIEQKEVLEIPIPK